MPEDRRQSDRRKGEGWQAHRKGSLKGGACPACGHTLSRVYDDRDSDPSVRCRECARCGARWTTREVFDRRIA